MPVAPGTSFRLAPNADGTWRLEVHGPDGASTIVPQVRDYSPWREFAEIMNAALGNDCPGGARSDWHRFAEAETGVQFCARFELRPGTANSGVWITQGAGLEVDAMDALVRWRLVPDGESS